MAVGGADVVKDFKWSTEDAENVQEQKDEVLVFQSLYEVEGDQRFCILSDGPNDASDDQMFSLQFLVPVKTTCSDITVNVCIPETEFNENELHKDVVLQRSESRNTVFASFSVKFLTPLKLMVVLPPEYPSSAPPIFTLSSLWLNGDQLTALCSQLDMLWQEYPSMPILNTWIDWLEHNSLSHLSIKNTVFIQQYVTDDDFDTRAVPECENIDDTVNEMLRHNIHEEMVEFLRYDQECNICFCEKSGRDFYKLLPCKHHFCKECLAEHCSVHVKEGTVQHLLCPEPKCLTEIRPYILKETLNDEDYQRWERLNLQYGLDMMGDIMYCPRCQNVVVKEEDLGHCLSCMFTFCAKCSEKWHQGESCFFEKEDDKSEENDNKDKDEEDFESEEAKRKIRLRQQREVRSSYQLIKERTRQCHSCKAPIEKNGGCNKVICSRCFNAMCWSCGKDITKESYGHFSSHPACANIIANEDVLQRRYRNPTPVQIQEIEDAIILGGEGAQKNLIRCPRCRQRNLRGENKNNHMKCWNCRTNFCFLCAEVLMPPFTKHFTKSLCKQHTK